MIRLKIIPGEPIMLFVRIKGTNGEREMRAVLDTGSVYSVIPIQDARALGYDAYFDRISMPGMATPAVTKSDVIESDVVELQEIRVGDIVAKSVKAFAYEMPKLARMEATLGLSFLRDFKTTIDYSSGYLTIEPIWHDVHE